MFISVSASLVAQKVKHLPAMRKTQVQSLGGEDTLVKEMTTHSSTLVWKIPWTEKSGRLQSMGSQRVRDDWATSLSFMVLIVEKEWLHSHLWPGYIKYNFQEGNMAVATFWILYPQTNRMSFPALLEGKGDKDKKRKKKISHSTPSKFPQIGK